MLNTVAIDGYFEVEFNTQRFDTGAATDADATPTYRVYEEGNDTVIASGDCAKRDDANTAGFYYARAQVTTAAGYEVGKKYFVRVAATVNSVAGADKVGEFVVLPSVVHAALVAGTDTLPVDAIQLAGVEQSLTDLKDFADTGYNPATHRAAALVEAMGTDVVDAAAIKADAVTELQAGLATASALSTVSGLVDDLETRLSAARAGYLDNLSGGAVATASALSTLSGLVDDLEGRLTAARAGYLDELGAANIPADIDTLLGRLTALRAGYLDELSSGNIPADVDSLLSRMTAARAGYLDSLAKPGKLIFVHSGGNDTTGDGSKALPYKTLTKAVSMATDGGGDTIILMPSAGAWGYTLTDTNTVTVNKCDLTIIGPGPSVVLDGTGFSGQYALDVQAENVHVENFKVIGTAAKTACIQVPYDGCIVRDMVVDGLAAPNGIKGVVSGGSYNLISRCTFLRGSSGVQFSGTGTGSEVSDCTFLNPNADPSIGVIDFMGSTSGNRALRNRLMASDGDTLPIARDGAYDLIAENVGLFSIAGTQTPDIGVGNIEQNNEQWATGTNLAVTDAVADAIKVVTDKLATMLSASGGNWQYTADALELAPAGGGGTSDWTENERTAIKAILGVVTDNATPGDPTAGILDTIRDSIDAITPSTEPSGFAVTVTVTLDGDPVLDALVTLQAAGGTTQYRTNASGVVDDFVRPAGSYALTVAGTGSYQDYSGTLTVSSGGVVTGNTVALTAITIPAPTSADNYVVWATEYGLDGNDALGASAVTVKIVDCDPACLYTAADGSIRHLLGTEFVTDANGQWSFEIAKAAVETRTEISLSFTYTTGTPTKVVKVAWMDETVANGDDQIAFAAWKPRIRSGTG